MRIIEATEAHLPNWLALRRQLWPEQEAFHLPEMRAILDSDSAVAFLLLDGSGKALGFIEGALYLENAQGYGYIEGWYVVPEQRRIGLGGQLLGALEEWVLHHSIARMLSDTLPDEYPLSPAAHARHGYKTFSHIQVFIKQIGARDGDGA